jgi:hypothetical protein
MNFQYYVFLKKIVFYLLLFGFLYLLVHVYED